MRIMTMHYDINIFWKEGLVCFSLDPGETVELQTDEAAAFIAALQENLVAVKRSQDRR